MLTDLSNGARAALAGMKIIFHPEIRVFLIGPIVINVLIFSGALWLFLSLASGLASTWLPSWLTWLQWLIVPLVWLSFGVLVFHIFSLLANLIAAPFNALLSERVEKILTGQDLASDIPWKKLPALWTRTLFGEGQRLIHLGLKLCLVILISLIPGINIIAPLAWAIFGAWSQGVTYLDYPFANRHMSFNEQLIHFRTNKAWVLGFGGVVTVMMLTPVMNFVVMPTAVCGATVLWVQRFKPVLTAQPLNV